MEAQNKFIILLYDKASPHVSENAGVIHSFKAQYCRCLLQFQLNEFNKIYITKESSKEINIKIAIDWLVEAWNKVSCETIINCWKKTEILLPSMFDSISVPSTPSSDSTITDDLTIDTQKTEEEIQDLMNKLPYDNILNVDEYINIDNISGNVDLTNEEIINIIHDEVNEKEQIAVKNAIDSIDNLLQFVNENSILKINDNEKKLLYVIQQKIYNMND
ncbi:7729_t:CDS:2 [Scutellospora calospora]|uniref:7729_t:CDS:1 n=1 Tax=Scutellospora calospora TaxID=85575 RepID=A0ACA9KM73_9GLOM|nr:7729_t:CDS:2 [Scutellospora calospora]